MERADYKPGALAETSAEPAEGDRWTLVFIRDFRHPPQKVWGALVEPGQLREWAPFVPDRDLGGTGSATFTMLGGDGGEVESSPAEVLRSEPPALLVYDWGGDLLRWELAPTGEGTRLTLRHTVRDRTLVPMVAAGWHICLDVADLLLDGRPIGPIVADEATRFGWEDLRDGYAERLAPG
ncbi:SRPBCC family protein [Phytohabitans sp. ZYX-F-186]|uniref:SRPBCC family protein n=1 Tax=Phytohabitans maris TaxID=3071409 RepID=A0ABU0ZWL5_9ACTN|nr:SRPBCC family protein [Phytohabitans sp. ZYX-F-186]MDQ7911431.1 SRPBCC family protein [Phytohabitans sp. ZYX-F-186]